MISDVVFFLFRTVETTEPPAIVSVRAGQTAGSQNDPEPAGSSKRGLGILRWVV